MKNSNDLVNIAKTIADALLEGLSIGFSNSKGEQQVVVSNPDSGYEIRMTVNHPRIICPRDYKFVYGAKSNAKADQEVKPEATTAQKKKNSRWWSRFNFEKNIMKMTLLALQDRYPTEQSFTQDMFAAKLAAMMKWKHNTARKHITQAAKMGLITRAIIGTAYHVTGINDVDAQTLKEELAEREQPPVRRPLPGEKVDVEGTIVSGSAIAHEARPLFELELEKAVDETLLP